MYVRKNGMERDNKIKQNNTPCSFSVYIKRLLIKNLLSIFSEKHKNVV